MGADTDNAQIPRRLGLGWDTSHPKKAYTWHFESMGQGAHCADHNFEYTIYSRSCGVD